jgi:gluconolactonase
MKTVSTAVLLIACGLVVVNAQSRTALQSVPIVRIDPALDRVIAPDTKLEVLKDDYFGIAEGPVWVRDGAQGHLLFSDIAANVIYKWSPDGALSVFMERSGFTGTDLSPFNIGTNGRLLISTVGSNGLALDREGRLVLTAQGDRAIVRIEKDGTRTILADRYEGKRLNGPNDLALKSDGAVYFTDPGSALAANSPLRELPFRGVLVAANGRVRLLDKDLEGAFANGIAFSPDEKYLYVNGGGKIFRYDVLPDGGVANRKLFLDMTMRSDGMKVDEHGNVYSSGPGGVWVISSDGKHLGTLPSDRATNVAFGGDDRRTVYITSQRSLFRIRVIIPGPRPSR